MAFWQIALGLLAVAWGLHAVGVWFQMRHFRDVFGAVTEKWDDGRVGAGNARGTFGKGVIAMVVVDPADTIRRVMIMEGRSVFAAFKALPEWQDASLDRLRTALDEGELDKARTRALASAIEQLDTVAARAADRDLLDGRARGDGRDDQAASLAGNRASAADGRGMTGDGAGASESAEPAASWDTARTKGEPGRPAGADRPRTKEA